MLAFALVCAGGAVTYILTSRLPGFAQRPPFARENFRGRLIPGSAGAVLVVPLLGGALTTSLTAGATAATWAMAGAGVAFTALGLLDDLYGDRSTGGLLGHGGELLRGRVTTGAVKASGGAAIGLGASAALAFDGWWIVGGGVVVALASNLANLLDVRPGRTLKAAIPCAFALAAVGAADELAIAALIGGASAFVVCELRELVMLGDAGAGLIGGVLGVAALAVFGPGTALLVALAVLAALHVVAEVTTFSRIISAMPPLRWIDELGRLP